MIPVLEGYNEELLDDVGINYLVSQIENDYELLDDETEYIDSLE